MPDWSDRFAVAEYAARGAEILGDDPAAALAAAPQHHLQCSHQPRPAARLPGGLWS